MIDPNTLDLAGLWAHLTRDGLARRLLELAREEDLGDAGDVTAAAMGSSSCGARGVLRARTPGVIAGLAALPMLVEVFGWALEVTAHAQDGERVAPGAPIATFTGDLDRIVTLERTMLNLLGRLSGIATLTRAYVDAVAGTGAAILDTRKTTPGLRAFEKYAVRCGGGRSHRAGLFDAVLVKDNHLAGIPLGALTGELTRAAERARAMSGVRFVEVEVDTLDQLDRLLEVRAGLIDIALLDNMTPDALREGVRRRDGANPALRLEASGGVALGTVRAIAESGVDWISIGALTHGAVSLDLGLDIDPDGSGTMGA